MAKPINMIFILLALVFLFIGCSSSGGSSGDSPNEGELGKVIEAPEFNSISVNDDQVSVSWNQQQNRSYNIYVATESIEEAENYSLAENAALYVDIDSPFTFSVADFSKVYHVYVTAIGNESESALSDRAIAVARYQESPANGWVRDRVTGLEWRRCFLGTSYNSVTKRCEGSVQRLYFSEAEQAAEDLGGRIPGAWERASISFCDTGSVAWFVDSENPSQIEQANCSNTYPLGGVSGFNLIANSPYEGEFPTDASSAAEWTTARCTPAGSIYIVQFQDFLQCQSGLNDLWLKLRPVRDY